MERDVVLGVEERQLERHADRDLIRLAPHDRRDEPDTLLELDETDDVRIVDRRHLRVVHDGVAVERRPPAGDDPVVVEVPCDRIAVRRGMDERAGGGEPLDPQFALAQALPEPCLVLVVLRPRSERARRRWRLLTVLRDVVRITGGRAVAEHLEVECPDALARVVDELGLGGDEVADAETGRLLL